MRTPSAPLLTAGMCLISLSGWQVAGVYALPQKPTKTYATWSGELWGSVTAMPSAVKPGQKIIVYAGVVGSIAGNPEWRCTQWGWKAAGTHFIRIDAFKSSFEFRKDPGDPPPLGWENRLSDTCYCNLTSWGAQGNCATREVQPTLFFASNITDDPWTPLSGSHRMFPDPGVVIPGQWNTVGAQFSGWAGAGWSSYATDSVYLFAETPVKDTDNDGIPDDWEESFAPTASNPLEPFDGPDDPPPRPPGTAVLPADPTAPQQPGWQPPSPYDFDGDGISNYREFVYWSENRVDAYGVPYSPTIINYPSGSCLFFPIKAHNGKVFVIELPSRRLDR